MDRRLLDNIGERLFVGTFVLAMVGLLLIIGVQVGRYKERIDGQSSFALCNRYVAALGDELEIEKKKNRVLISELD